MTRGPPGGTGVTQPTQGGHGPDIDGCSHGAMTGTPAPRHIPDDVSVVQVYGSTFLLEWLDLGVLASAAAQHPADRPPVAPTPRDEAA